MYKSFRLMIQKDEVNFLEGPLRNPKNTAIIGKEQPEVLEGPRRPNATDNQYPRQFQSWGI